CRLKESVPGSERASWYGGRGARIACPPAARDVHSRIGSRSRSIYLMAAPYRQRFRAIALTLRAGLHFLMVSPYRAHIRSAHAQPLMRSSIRLGSRGERHHFARDFDYFSEAARDCLKVVLHDLLTTFAEILTQRLFHALEEH